MIVQVDICVSMFKILTEESIITSPFLNSCNKTVFYLFQDDLAHLNSIVNGRNVTIGSKCQQITVYVYIS